MRTDPTFQKWCIWLNIIREDVDTLYFYRFIFQGVVGIVNSNEHLDTLSPFFGFFERVYGDSILMGIRRQLKIQNDSISLARLFSEVAANPALVTRLDFYEVFSDLGSLKIASIRREAFDRFATPDAPHIDAARVEADLLLLKESCAQAEEYSDRRIAHWDRRQPGFSLTFDSIHKALDLVGELVHRYYLLFYAVHLDLLPRSDYPIFDVFQEPWSIDSSASEKIGGA